MLEEIGIWVGILSGIVVVIGFLIQYGPRIWGLQNLIKGNYPRLVGILLVIAFALSSFSIYIWTVRSPGMDTFQPPPVKDLKLIKDQTFINETVELDGKNFEHCNFVNVKFLFHGYKTMVVKHSDFYGTIVITTDRPAISAFGELLAIFEAFGPETTVDTNQGTIRITKVFSRTGPLPKP